MTLTDEQRPRYRAIPVNLADANAYIDAFHRHNGSLPSAKFAVAAVDPSSGVVHGVAVAGRPKARLLDDGQTLEVNRVCSDGARNCCSFLYSRCIKAARALGYHHVITYTLDAESGASLKASGWTRVEVVEGGSWLRPNQPLRNCGTDSHDLGPKVKWEIRLDEPMTVPVRWPEEAKPHQPVLFEMTA